MYERFGEAFFSSMWILSEFQKPTLEYISKTHEVSSYHRNGVKYLENHTPSPVQCKFGQATN